MNDSRGGEGEEGPILFFDGICHFCQRTVQFVIRREREPKLRFAPLESEISRRVVPAEYRPPHADSLVLWDDHGFHVRSKAVTRLGGYLRYPWRVAFWFRWLPAWMGDPVYRWVARNRYRWFGKSASCLLLKDQQHRLVAEPPEEEPGN